MWIGALDLSQAIDEGVQLLHSEGYSRARLLVRDGRTPIGFVEVAVNEGAVTVAELRQGLAELPPPASMRSPAVPSEAVSVVLCTRDRPESLATAIASVLALDFPAFEVVVVDNASVTDATKRVVAGISDPRVRLISEPVPGLARARNRGVLEASYDIVAFTDDDVVVDPGWLWGLMDGFDAARDVACVCGIVPSGELRSFSQAFFDGRVTWGRSCTQQLYRLSTPPPGQVLFPFQVGQFGTGANFALRRSTVLALGGFDEALGVGSPTRGGEDIDMFVRVLLAGHGLVYQPSALVWHRHRADAGALREQIAGYGVGLGAWITKLMLDRRTLWMVLRRAARGTMHARRMTRVTNLQVEGESAEYSPRALASVELKAMMTGPFHYLRARLRGARRAPLLLAADTPGVSS
jgi:GT2 family glycosyltransferase